MVFAYFYLIIGIVSLAVIFLLAKDAAVKIAKWSQKDSAISKDQITSIYANLCFRSALGSALGLFLNIFRWRLIRPSAVFFDFVSDAVLILWILFVIFFIIAIIHIHRNPEKFKGRRKLINSVIIVFVSIAFYLFWNSVGSY